MIFVTTGTQLTFPRLINDIYEIRKSVRDEIYIQSNSKLDDQENIISCSTMSRNDFLKVIKKSELVISHAGMGTILTCIKENKKLILYPRLFEKGEHRNDHQKSTANKFNNYENIKVAYNNEELIRFIKYFKNNEITINKNIVKNENLISLKKNIQEYLSIS